MQASRASSRAFKHLAASNKQVRGLHMTGPATFSSLITSERPAFNLPGDAAGLRTECQKRNLPTAGTQAELVDRLSAHEMTHSRAFSTAVQDSKRPVPQTANPGAPIRHFNTSRSLKAVKDSSTIDFAYFPDFDPDSQVAPIIRVPILPHTVVSARSRAHTAVDVEEEVMLPTIFTVSGDATHIHAPSAMSDVTDNGAVDFQGMAAQFASKIVKPVEEGVGMTRQLWNGIVDDILGPKSQKSSHA